MSHNQILDAITNRRFIDLLKQWSYTVENKPMTTGGIGVKTDACIKKGPCGLGLSSLQLHLI